MEIDRISFKKQIDEAIKALDDVRGVRIPSAVSKALNQTARQALRATTQAARRIYTIEAARLNQAVSIKPASRGRLEAVVWARGRTPGLQHYKAREVRLAGGGLASFGVSKQGGLYGKGVRRGRRGVTVEVFKGKRLPVKGGFLAVMPSGGVGVFRRAGKSRLPIKRLFGPSVPGMFRSRLKNTLLSVARERFRKNFQRELRNELFRLGRVGR